MEKVVRLAPASTKFQAPTYDDGLVQRERLITLLREGRSRRLTLIHAPAGFGKTTLAVQWLRVLRDDDVPVAWLSLDRDDNDVAWFVSHLVESIRRVDQSLPGELVDVLEQPSEDVPRYVLTELINHVAGQGRSLAVVLDDWHVIGDPDTVSALDFLLEAGPPNLHLIITSRTRSPAIGRLRVDNQVTEVDATQLRFDHSESADFLLGLNALPLDANDIRQLWSSTDGWVAALQLATLSLRGSQDPSAMIQAFSGRHHSIGDYLAENVLDALAPDLLDFLLTTSVCDRLCGDLAAAVSGQRKGQALLEELERRDLFLRPLDDEREWFRYHHLFAAYLQRRLERDQPERVEALHRTAAEWFTEHGLIAEAVTHALAAGDSSGALDLVESHAMDLVEDSHMATLLRLVDKLPTALLPSRPALQLAVAWANCLLQRPEPAQAALDHVRAAIKDDGEGGSATLAGEADILQACIDVYRDRIDRAPDLVAPYLDLTSTARPFLIAVAGNIQTFVDIHSFAYDVALQRQRSIAPFHEAAGGPFAGVYGLCFGGLAAFALLDLTTAERMYQQAFDLACRTAGPRSHAARLAGSLLGQLRYERDDMDGAEQLLEACHELGAESGVVDFMIPTYVTLARIKALRGDLEGAWALLDEGGDAAAELRLPRLQAAIQHERVQIHLALGETERANDVAAYVESDLPLDVTGGVDAAIRHHLLTLRARTMAAAGRLDHALELAAEVLRDVEQAHQPHAEVVARLELAAVQFIAGQADRGAETAIPALVTASQAGLVRSVLDVGPSALRIVSELRDAQRRQRWPEGMPDVRADYLARLLSTAHADAGRAAFPVIDRPIERRPMPEEPLNAREVDILRLLERGLANKEIARNLGLTINTVKWYLKNIYVKLGVTRRGESVAEARRRRILL
jgi:serine/threonine-protein kinase PknK